MLPGSCVSAASIAWMPKISSPLISESPLQSNRTPRSHEDHEGEKKRTIQTPLSSILLPLFFVSFVPSWLNLLTFPFCIDQAEVDLAVLEARAQHLHAHRV